ncbi:MAG: LamG-like jellyroll fold domain-containing protein [bacterium]
MKTNYTKAFTLIELLVVISIIGLLASIVLTSLEGGEQRAITGKAMSFSHTVRVSLGSDLVGEWKFDDTINPAVDSSGGGNDGTIVGDPVQGTGVFGQAMEFGGDADRIEVQHDILNTTEAFTVSAWVRPREYKTTAWEIKIVADRNTVNAFTLYQYNNSINFAVWNNSETVFNLVASNSLKIDNWIYAVGIFNGSDTMEFYVNAELAGSRSDITGTLRDNLGTLFIGADSTSGSARAFNGTIDEVSIYNRALSMSEIQQLYAEGAVKHGLTLK